MPRRVNASDKSKRIQFTVPMNIQAAAGNGNAPFDMVAYNGGLIDVGWGDPVVVDLAGMQLAATIPLLESHMPFHDYVLGQCDEVTIQSPQILAKGQVMPVTDTAKEVIALAKVGFKWQASIGARVLKRETLAPGVTAEVNGQTVTGPVVIVRESRLDEISIVVIGADRTTDVAIAARGRAMDTPAFRAYLKANGFDFDTLSAKDRRKYWLQFNGSEPENAEGEGEEPENTEGEGEEPENTEGEGEEPENTEGEGEEPEGEEPEAPAAASASANHRPVAVGGGHMNPLQTLRAGRPTLNPRLNQGPRLSNNTILECALRMGAGQEVEKEYSEQVLDAAQPYARFGLKQLMMYCCQMEGKHLSLLATERDMVKAAFSTRSFANILKNTANKSMLAAYESVEKQSLKVSKILNANDFKQHDEVRLTGDFQFEKVGTDGELKHAQMADQGFPYSVDTYGKIMGITRQDVINDDLNAFTGLPTALGMGAALMLEEMFWAMVEGNAGNFMHANNKNLVTTGSVFGASGLGLAVLKMRQQLDPFKKKIQIRPKFMVVPSDLEAAADTLYTSSLLITGTGATQGSNNIYANKYQPIPTEYLTGNGVNSAWYLFGDPMLVPAFGIAFLRGARNPIIEEADPDPKYLGQIWRGYIDVGVCQLDPRGVVKCTGANP